MLNKSNPETIKLKVPFIKQIDYACGAATLEMIYKYYGIKNISQEDIFNKHKIICDDSDKKKYGITGESLVEDAKFNGFENSYWGKLNHNNTEEIIMVLNNLLKEKLPIIVLQRFKKNKGSHFRLVTGFDVNKNLIYLHDPFTNPIIWSINKFKRFWQPLGSNVKGGVFIIIKK